MALKTLITLAAIAGIASTLLSKRKTAHHASGYGDSMPARSTSGGSFTDRDDYSGSSSSGASTNDGPQDFGGAANRAERQD